MGAYGTSGSAPNETFPFELGLAAARDLWSMADEVQAADGRISSAKERAIIDFLGPKLSVFLDRRSVDATTAQQAFETLRGTADQIAAAWARARGNQDRINHARWVAAQKADDNILERGFQALFGETDYGPEPDDPPPPSGPRFEPTRAPIHPEYE